MCVILRHLTRARALQTPCNSTSHPLYTPPHLFAAGKANKCTVRLAKMEAAGASEEAMQGMLAKKHNEVMKHSACMPPFLATRIPSPLIFFTLPFRRRC